MIELLALTATQPPPYVRIVDSQQRRSVVRGLATSGTAILATLADGSYPHVPPQIAPASAGIKIERAHELPGWTVAGEALSRWRSYGVGWDGEDAAQPDQIALSNASIFVIQAQSAAVPGGEPFITADGELGFRWSKADGFASVSFAEDGHVIAFARAPGEDQALRIDSPFLQADLTLLFAGIQRLT